MVSGGTPDFTYDWIVSDETGCELTDIPAGFYNVEVTDAYSSIIDEENFILTYSINAGKKFNFGKFKLILPTDFERKKFSKLEKLFRNLEDTK